MKSILQQILTCLTIISIPLLAETYKYDFTSEKSPVQEGFTRITDKNSEDCKWSSGQALASSYTPFSYEIKNNNPPARYPIHLSAGKVQGMREAQFTLPKVAPGKYHIWALCGFGGGAPYTVWDIRMKVGDAVEQITFQGINEIMDMHLETEISQASLPITIESRGHWVLNALVIVPQAEWPQVRDGWFKELWEEIFILPKPVRKQWKYDPRPCTTPEPHWNDRQKEDGIAVYTRNWASPIWSDHFPLESELDAPVHAFASLGESEILNFSLYALQEFEQVSISVGALQGPKENIFIPASEIDVRYVRYMYVRPNYNIHGVYYRAPDVLMPYRKPLRLPKGENLRFWLTVRTPLYTTPGLYKGEATVKASTLAGKTTTLQVPLTLRVLPIRLLEDEKLIFGQYYYPPNNRLTQTDDSFSRAWIEQRTRLEHEHLRDCRHTCYNLNINIVLRDGKYYPDFDSFQHQMDTARQYGITGPIPTGFGATTIYHYYMKASAGSHIVDVQIPPQEYFDEITRIVSEIQREAKRRQWPELLYYPVDEPSTSPNSVEFMRRIMEAIKKVPDACTYITADVAETQFAPLIPFVDVWCGQPFSIPREKVLKDMAKRPGLEYWAYPNHISGENDHTPCVGARMTYGFGLWNSGYRALIPWIYGSSSGSQWNYLDSKTSDFDNRVDMDGSPIPVTLWAAYMEGMDDGRYLNTLEKLIGRAKDAGFTAEAQRAQADIDFVRSSIKVQPKYKDKDLWDADTFDAYRWLLASRIIELQKLF